MRPRLPRAPALRICVSCMRKLCAAGPSALDTLCMGMSADLELAIAEGSTMMRVGTDLFGAAARA